jgi:formyl-CoA transferase
MLHPIGLDGDFMQPTAAAFRKAWRVIRIDLRGHGRSPSLAAGAGLDTHVADIRAAIEAHCRRPAILLGVSFGGMLAQLVALADPQIVAGLVLCGCPPRIAPENRPMMRERALAAERDGMEAIVAPTIERWFTPSFAADPWVTRVRNRLLTDDRAAWSASWHAIGTFDALPRLGEIAVPTLVVAGERDAATPLAASEALAQAIRGARLVKLPGAPHMMQLERPDDFNAAVGAFLDEHRDAVARGTPRRADTVAAKRPAAAADINAAPGARAAPGASAASAARAPAALDGIRVVDLTQFEAGTSCTETLAWLGADVIKVEPPGKGEQGRTAHDKDGYDSHYFLLLNANKRSVTCNLKSDEGRALLTRLLEHSDVFIENYAPGVIERLGFGYDVVTKINPRIVYAQIKGFAPDGPYAKFLAFDPIAQAAGGGLSITGEEDGRPLKPGLNVGDTGAGLHCTIGILAALFQRQASGKGQRIEVSMQDAVINFGRIAYAAQALFGKPAPRAGNQSIIAGTSPSEVYPCEGGGPNDYCYVYTTRAGNHQWLNLLKVVGREDLNDDPRFATPKMRQRNFREVDEIVSAWTRRYDKHTVMKILGDAGVPASAVFDTVELSNDPHLRERGTFVKVTHPNRGDFVMPGFIVKMTGSHVPVKAAPLLAADNESVYGDLLGLSAAELDELRDKQAI